MLALTAAAATCFLAGLSWVVQVVVYPAFELAGRTPRWREYHDAHSRRIAAVVGPAWAVQGITVVWLLARAEHLELVVPIAVLAGATVALTLLGAVPAHARLAAFDTQTLATLRRFHAWRTAAWSAGAALCLVLVRVTG